MKYDLRWFARKIALPNKPKCPQRLLCFDPGLTTGWAYFNGYNLIAFGQIDSYRAMGELFDWVAEKGTARVVVESFKLYAHKSKHLAGNEFPSVEYIGIAKYLCDKLRWKEPIMQTAQLAKGFFDDERLKLCKLHQRGKPHANDAIRHGAYFLVFGWKKLYLTSKKT